MKGLRGSLWEKYKLLGVQLEALWNSLDIDTKIMRDMV